MRVHTESDFLKKMPVIRCGNTLPSAAAVQWANINPELRPPFFTRKAGSSLSAVKQIKYAVIIL